MVNSSHFLKEFRDPEHTIYFVEDLYKEGSEQSNIYTMLNSQRNFFVENRIRVVFWLTQNEVVNFAHYAPDFWAQRHCLIELTKRQSPNRFCRRPSIPSGLELEIAPK